MNQSIHFTHKDKTHKTNSKKIINAIFFSFPRTAPSAIPMKAITSTAHNYQPFVISSRPSLPWPSIDPSRPSCPRLSMCGCALSCRPRNCHAAGNGDDYFSCRCSCTATSMNASKSHLNGTNSQTVALKRCKCIGWEMYRIGLRQVLVFYLVGYADLR